MWRYNAGIYVDESLEKYGIFAFTTTAVLGDMKDASVMQKFLLSVGIENFVCGEQTHSTNFRIVSKTDSSKRFCNTDGYITTDKKVALCVFTADCMPVFVYDRVNAVIGLFHIGRVAAKKLFLADVLEAFYERYGSLAKNISISVGPHIKKCCYEIDLFSMLKEQAFLKGIKDIRTFRFCTHCEKFFSYRKNKTAARMVSCMIMR